MKNLFKKTNQKGFTIIEVMIVLAIGALILVVVLIAIPQLQRNQRNQARQTIAARIVTEVNNYAGNNNGVYPEADPTEWAAFVGRYLDDDSTADPQTGTNIGSTTQFGGVTLANLPISTTAGEARYAVNSECDGEGAVPGAGARTFSYQVQLEGGAVYCLDNR